MAASLGRSSILQMSCVAPSEAFGSPPSDLSGLRRSVLFGRRRGRALRPRQRLLMRDLLPRLALSIPPSGQLEPWAAFGPMRRSVWLEIGFGGGEHLVHQAERHPEAGLIGCEMFENGIARLLVQIDRLQLGNIRVFSDDARLLLAALPPASIDRGFILFPDPWPKHRHQGRRIATRETLDALAVIMMRRCAR